MSEFPTYRTKADLEKLLAEGAVEGTQLEFKDSRALTREEPKIVDLCINVSAFANSAGGQIIFGINENKKSNGPVVVDDGVADKTITREWIGQILNSRIHPRLHQYAIDQVDMGNGGSGFVISVPQSQSGPHQAPDHKYYKRFELQVRAMEDYEIRDVMRRSTTPELHVEFSFKDRERADLHFDERQEHSNPIILTSTLRNESAQPAQHAIVKLGISSGIGMNGRGGWESLGAGETDDYGKIAWFSHRISSPPDMPVFKEQALSLPILSLLFHSRTLSQGHYWRVLVDIACPGFTSFKAWAILQQGYQLRVLTPDHPMMR